MAQFIRSSLLKKRVRSLRFPAYCPRFSPLQRTLSSRPSTLRGLGGSPCRNTLCPCPPFTPFGPTALYSTWTSACATRTTSNASDCTHPTKLVYAVSYPYVHACDIPVSSWVFRLVRRSASCLLISRPSLRSPA